VTTGVRETQRAGATPSKGTTRPHFGAQPQHPRLDSLPTGACILTRKGEAPVRTACNLELATDFGGMHLPPAVKGLSVLMPRVVDATSPGRKQQKVIAIRRRAGSPPTETGRGDQIVSRDTRVRECDLIKCCVASPNVSHLPT